MSEFDPPNSGVFFSWPKGPDRDRDVSVIVHCQTHQLISQAEAEATLHCETHKLRVDPMNYALRHTS